MYGHCLCRSHRVAVAPGMLDMFRSQIGRLVLRNKVSVAPRSASLLSHLFPLAMVLLPAGYVGPVVGVTELVRTSFHQQLSHTQQ